MHCVRLLSVQQLRQILLRDWVHQHTLPLLIGRCRSLAPVDENDGEDGVELDDVRDRVEPLKDRRQER